MGLSNHLVIDRDKGDGKGLVLRDTRQSSSDNVPTYDRYSLARSEKGVKRLKIKQEETKDITQDVFAAGVDHVLLSKPKKRRETERQSSDDESDWSPLIGSSKPTTPADKDLQYESASESDEEYIQGQTWGDRGKMVELVRRVESHPNDVDAWIAYVDAQDGALSSGSRRKTKSERHSIAEVKLDILSKALLKNPGNDVLLLRFMDVAGTIWDSRKLLERWKKILQENPTLVSLWTRYLNFRQTDIISFTYPECAQCFAECLDVLRNASYKVSPGSEDRKVLEDMMVYVFMRTVSLMRDSGYWETAIATLQCIMELNFFRPSHVKLPNSPSEQSNILSQLEVFWDSEVPRVGETNSRGWMSFVQNGEVGDAPDPLQDPPKADPLDSEDLFHSWLTAEKSWTERPHLPARTTDEVEEDDPYRVVLFSDIKTSMFCLSCPESMDSLLDTFLIVNELPPLRLHSSNSSLMKDTFLRQNVSSASDSELKDWLWPKKDRKWVSRDVEYEGMEPERKSHGEDPFRFKMKNFPLGRESWFDREGKWFSSHHDFRMEKSEMIHLVRRTLKCVVEKTSNEALAVYYLAWEWANAPEGYSTHELPPGGSKLTVSRVRKVAKSLLQQFRTSLRIWTSYAQIECYKNGIEAGRKIFAMALDMTKSGSNTLKRDGVMVQHSWIWEELQAGHLLEARRIILSIFEDKQLHLDSPLEPDTIPKHLILAAQRHFEDGELRLRTTHPDLSLLHTDLRSLLFYLFTPSNSFTLSITPRRAPPSAPEALVELSILRHLRLLYLHYRITNYFRSSLFRSALDSALSKFPHNTAFLSLYVANEARTRIENRVRNVLFKCNASATYSSSLLAIWAELHMSQNYNRHAVRRLFEAACDDVGGAGSKNSTLLWKLWIRFEESQGEKDTAIDVWRRAVGKCPWSKDIVLEGLKVMADGTKSWDTSEEFVKVVRMAAEEKELRFRDVTELEDEWDNIKHIMTEGRKVFPEDESGEEMDED